MPQGMLMAGWPVRFATQTLRIMLSAVPTVSSIDASGAAILVAVNGSPAWRGGRNAPMPRHRRRSPAGAGSAPCRNSGRDIPAACIRR